MLHPTRAAVAIALLTLPSLAVPRSATAEPSRNLHAAASVFAPVTFAANIRGKVTDKESGQPIQAAQVSAVVGTSRIGALTDANGEYVIRGAPAGQLRVTVARIGFTPASQTVTVPADGDVTVDFVRRHARIRSRSPGQPVERRDEGSLSMRAF
jgi:hypothetical protein